ncbi:MAG: glycosyltransferase [Longimicrobiales bacterium]
MICTRSRPALLRQALQSLTTQSCPPSELLVVDNAGPGERSAAAVVAAFRGVRYVREVRAGLDVARNTALTRTRAPVIACLDDDAVADRARAGRLLDAFSDPAVGACTGRVEPLSLDQPGQRLFEANGGFSRGPARIELPRDARRRLHGVPAPLIAWVVSVGSGCSLAVRRAAAKSIGGFDERLDLGEALPGGGDHDLLWRLLAEGWNIVYEPEALAWHEHRPREADAIAQIAGHQRALVAFLSKSLKHASLRQAVPIAAFLAWRLVKPGAQLIRRAARRDPLPAHALIALWQECWRGLAAYDAPRTPVHSPEMPMRATSERLVAGSPSGVRAALTGRAWVRDLRALLFLIRDLTARNLETIAAFYHDVQHSLPILLLILFYLSPVFYPTALVPASAAWLYQLNPVAVLLGLYHSAIYGGVLPSGSALLDMALMSLVVCAAGWLVFRRFRGVIAEVL